MTGETKKHGPQTHFGDKKPKAEQPFKGSGKSITDNSPAGKENLARWQGRGSYGRPKQ